MKTLYNNLINTITILITIQMTATSRSRKEVVKMSRGCALMMLDGLVNIKHTMHWNISNPNSTMFSIYYNGVRQYPNHSAEEVANILEVNLAHYKNYFYQIVEAQQDIEKALREQKDEHIAVDMNWSLLMETLNFYFNEHPVSINKETGWAYVKADQLLCEIIRKF